MKTKTLTPTLKPTDKGYRGYVTVIEAPISTRYWNKGDECEIFNGQILSCGAWFDFDDRWKVREEWLEEFIYNTLKPGRNSIRTTIFMVVGIGNLTTKRMVADAMRLKQSICKVCMITEDSYKVNYQTLKWDKLN